MVLQSNPDKMSLAYFSALLSYKIQLLLKTFLSARLSLTLKPVSNMNYDKDLATNICYSSEVISS